MKNKHENASLALMRETHYLLNYQGVEIEKRLLSFSGLVTSILKKHQHEITTTDLNYLKNHMKINEIINEVMKNAQEIQKKYDLAKPEDLKRYQARILILAEEKIINVIESLTPNIADFIRDDLNSKLITKI